jgi:hypothetical protein
MKTRKYGLFKELIRMAEETRQEGTVSGNKISWPSLEASNYGTHWQQNGMLFTGNAGIGLFYNDLYALTRDASFLRVCEASMAWVEEYLKTCKVNHPAFYIGNAGIAYVYLRLFESTSNEHYRNLALTLLRGKSRQVSDTEVSPDLLSGHAGIIISLLYAHALTREADLLDILSNHVNHLLDRAMIDHAGLKWGYKAKNINSLCGLSHGASGIGYAFVLLARYFDNASFIWVADQAFAYERQYYTRDINNWLDLRLLESPEKARQAFSNNDLSFFYKGNDSNSWSHGAAGIGLIRLRAHAIAKNKAWLNEGLLAINKCIVTDLAGQHERSFSLSSGKAGVAELFLEAYRVMGKRKYLDYAVQIAEEAIAIRQNTGQYPAGLKESRYDNGLFMGRTGLAYLLLRVLNEGEHESVLLPGFRGLANADRDTKNHWLSRLTKEQLQKRIYQKYFKRSSFRADDDLPMLDEQAVHFLKDAAHGPPTFEALCATKATQKHQAIAQCTLALLKENRSYIYSVTRENISEIANQKAIQLNNDQFRQIKLQLNPAVAIICFESSSPREERTKAILLKRNGKTVQEFELNYLSEIIFRHTYAGSTVESLTHRVMKEVTADTSPFQPARDEKIMQQIRNLINAGFLDANVQ